MNSVCQVDGCDAKARGNAGEMSVCGKHYQRWAKRGSFLLRDGRSVISYEPKTCDVDGCQKTARTPNSPHCEMHYYRLRRASQLKLNPSPRFCQFCSGSMPEGRSRTKYCSNRCSWRANAGAPVIVECQKCNTPFDRQTNSPYCSDGCRSDAAKEAAKWTSQRHSHVTRAKEYGVHYEYFETREVFERDKWTCQFCGLPVDRGAVFPDRNSPSLDHKIPMAMGGAHTRENTQCVHLGCNWEKAHTDDVKRIAKAKRQALESGPQKRLRERKAAGLGSRLQGRGFDKSRKTNWPKRAWPVRVEK